MTKSRSTWACELKYTNSVFALCVYPSRSTWACELKFNSKICFIPQISHAPRERVSWNNQDSRGERVAYVTLHVSVWVEISIPLIVLGLAKSRSTWACELKFVNAVFHVLKSVTLHVSVWVEISSLTPAVWVFQSRSTWACELKYGCFRYYNQKQVVTLHVSVWVEIQYSSSSFVNAVSRSTWACELKYP